MIKSSDLSWIVVSDLEKARRFFVDALGLEEKTYVAEVGWSEMECSEGGARIGIAAEQQAGGVRAGQNAVMTFTVEDIEKTNQRLAANGVKLIGGVLEVPGHCKLQLFADADGNKFQLYQNTAK
jgi:predicted enzyme related to lactoylglutathione lyase